MGQCGGKRDYTPFTGLKIQILYCEVMELNRVKTKTVGGMGGNNITRIKITSQILYLYLILDISEIIAQSDLAIIVEFTIEDY